MSADTIVQRFLKQAEVRPKAPAYHERTSSGWESTDWSTYVSQVEQAARALINLGFDAGDKVAVLGFNRPEWAIAAVAAMTAGGAVAGVYTSCSPPEVQYIVDHAEAPVAVVESVEQWAKIEAELERLPKLRHVVLMRGAAKVRHDMVLSWDEFLARGGHTPKAAVHARVKAITPDDVATLIYTSGTTGPPKAVMLTHENVAWTARCASDLISGNHNDTLLSYLPMAHVAEQTFSIYVPATTGGQIYFAQSLEKLAENLQEVQPTVFFGVPRVWEKFHAGIAGKLAQATGVKAKLVAWARGVGTQAAAARARGQQPGGLAYALASKLIFSKLKPA
ncbi:MAG: AMP-binding protein, partial [Myxococcales bacterium]|nr:AMP-binding protein [Myxococcales bacterium]